MASVKDRYQREGFIIEELSRSGSVSVTQLSRDLGVSEVTIRKDLTEMESRDLLTRVSGGAVKVWETSSMGSLFGRVPRVKNL